MSCSLWNWTPACDTRACPGDCDLCDYDEGDYTTTTNTDNQSQPMKWEEFDDDL